MIPVVRSLFRLPTSSTRSHKLQQSSTNWLGGGTFRLFQQWWWVFLVVRTLADSPSHHNVVPVVEGYQVAGLVGLRRHLSVVRLGEHRSDSTSGEPNPGSYPGQLRFSSDTVIGVKMPVHQQRGQAGIGVWC